MENTEEDNLFPSYISKWIIIPFLIVFWFSIIFIPFCIGLYLYKFRNGFSNDISDFGQTGDFFGGLFNPLIASLTLFVTVVIARQVQHYGSKDSDRSIDMQKVTLRRQIQYNIVQSFNEKYHQHHQSLVTKVAATKFLNKHNVTLEVARTLSAVQGLDASAHKVFVTLGTGQPGREKLDLLVDKLDKWMTEDSLSAVYDMEKVDVVDELAQAVVACLYEEILEL